LQWAGPDALDLLAFLLRESLASGHPDPTYRPGQCLRVVGAYRDSDVTPSGALELQVGDLARDGLAAQLRLAPLSRQESAELLSSLLADAEETAAHPPLAALEEVLSRADGVPFFLVSCAQQLRVGGGLPGGTDGTEGATGGANEEAGGMSGGTQGAQVCGAIPWSVAQIIRSRVALLPKAAQEVLAVAAVSGRQTPYRVLLAAAQTSTLDEAGVVAALDTICRAQLLAEASESQLRGNGSYDFTHDLIREVIMADLTIARRALLHRRLAEAFKQQPARQQPPGELAWHFSEAGEAASALPFALEAGHQAAAIYAHRDAERYFQTAVNLAREVGDHQQEVEALERLGSCLIEMARFDDALDVLRPAAQMYRDAGDWEGEIRIAAHLGRLRARRGSPQEGISLLRPQLQTLQASGSHPPSRDLAILHLAVADLFHTSSEYQEELAAAERASALGDTHLQYQAQRRRGIALQLLGQVAEGTQMMVELLPLAESLGDPWSLCQVLNAIATVHRARGEFERGEKYIAQALTVAERTDDPALIAHLMSRRSHLAFYRGAWDQARADAERALQLIRQVGASWREMYILSALGELCLAEGHREAASDYLDAAARLATRSHDLQILRAVQRLFAERDLLEGNPQSARDRLEPLLDRPGHQEGHVTAFLPFLAQAHLELGWEDRAAVMIGEALERARTQMNVRALRAGAGHLRAAGRGAVSTPH